MSGKRLPLEILPQDVPQEIHSQIERCWSQQAANRPYFTEIRASLSTLTDLAKSEEDIRSAKETILTTFCQLSGSEKASDLNKSEHGQKIKRVYQTLCEFMRHSDQILSSLFVKRVVTQQENESIRSQTTAYEWISRLLDVLSCKPVSAYSNFLDALVATNQHHLVLLLEDKDYIMNIDHKATLIDNFMYLKDNITLTDTALLDALLEVGVLDEREKMEITSKTTDHERTDQLLQHILRTSEEQYQQFLEALQKAGHQHVYNRLKEGERTLDDETRDANDECESRMNAQPLNAQSFLENPRLLGVVPVGGYITAITVLNNQLFVLRDKSTQVNVYNANNFTLTRNIGITGSSSLFGIVASAGNNCFYVSDPVLYAVYQYSLSDGALSSWSVDKECYGLSLTSTYNVLVTMIYAKQIKEYTPDGSLVRVINLASHIVDPWHSIQLSSGLYAVCHGEHQSLHLLCIVDASGKQIHRYGRFKGSDVSKFNRPTSLAVDEFDNVLVADSLNDRVVLFSPSLARLGEITIPGHTLSWPSALHLDPLTRRLYIGEETGAKRVLVLAV